MSRKKKTKQSKRTPHSLEAQRAASGSREIDVNRSLQDAYEQMPDHIKQQVGAAIVEDAEVTLSAKSDGTVNVHRERRARRSANGAASSRGARHDA